MKPIKLNMCGWGSYPEEVVIDFTKFYGGNLFLITGPTGAGKTTIFDAVSFALYGDVSGKLRDKSSVRSDFASTQTDTYVELNFSHKGESYIIKRAPKYLRPKKRGDGFAISAEIAELHFEKEPPITTVKDVNNKITEMLGMNYEQFKQTSMIAQGEFMELLVSDSKNKVEIFRNLFKTEKYDKLQHMLAEKSKGLSAQIENLKNKMEEAVHGIDSSEDAYFCTLIQEEYINYDKILLWIRELTKEDKKQITAYEKQISELELSIKKYVALIMEGERTNQKLSKLEEMERKWKNLLDRKDRMEELKKTISAAALALHAEGEEKRYLDAAAHSHKFAEQKVQYEVEISKAEPEFLKCTQNVKEIEKIQDKIDSLQRESQKLEAFLPMMDELEEENGKLASAQMKITEQEQKKLEFMEQEKKLEQQAEISKKESESYVGLERKMAEHQLESQLCRSELQKLDETLQEYEHYTKVLEELNDCQNIYKKSEEELRTVKEIYGQKETIYKNAAVGLVAKFLKENEPCPVCGSLEHPHIARIAEEVPEEKELEQLKKKLEQKEMKFNGAYQAATQKKAEKDSKEKQLEGVFGQLALELHVSQQYGEESKLLLLNKKKIRQAELERMQILEEEEKEKTKRKEELQQILEKIEVSRMEYQLQKEKDSELFHQLIREAAVIKGTIEQLIRKLPEDLTKGQKDIREKLNKLAEEIQTEDKKILRIREDYQQSKVRLEKWKILYKKNLEDWSLAKEEEGKRENAFKNAFSENGFRTEKEYRMALRSKEETGQMEKAVKEYEEECQFVQVTKAGLEDEINEKSFVNIEKLQEQLTGLEEIKKELLENKEKTAARMTGNKRAIESISEKSKEKEKLEEEYGIVKELDNAARGNNKERIVFEHYVLASYFEDILYSANRHLFTMTGERYELMKVDRVTDARTKDSLELEVLDHYTGKKRSVKTLSGGESFKAALSLSLGLSDVVQNNAGGIQIDTLFIDEGFGSLDTESLEQAMDTITSLTEHNRLIGIISHVNELKERFDNQIVVEKETNGSRLCVINK